MRRATQLTLQHHTVFAIAAVTLDILSLLSFSLLSAPFFSSISFTSTARGGARSKVQKGRSHNPEEHVPIELFVTTLLDEPCF